MVAKDDTPLLGVGQINQARHLAIERSNKPELYETIKHCDESNHSNHGMPDSEKNTKSIWKDTNARQKAILIYIAILNFLSYGCTSFASPFLARVLLEKGSTVLFSTIILQISMITMAVFSLVIGKYQSRIGCKRLVVFGQIAFGMTQISFGLIGYIDEPWAVVTVGITLRALSGVFQASYTVAGLTIVCREFPDFISIVFGIFEAAYGAGAFVGPYLGGFLYDWSGNTLVPMAVCGSSILISSTLGFITLKESPNTVKQINGENDHISRILLVPRAILVIGAAVTVAGSFYVNETTVTVYLKAKGFSATGVGQLLFVIGVAYTVIAVITGFIASKKICIRRFMFLSGLVGSCAFPLIFTPGQMNIWIYFGAFGFATSGAFAFIPAFDELMCAVNRDESPTAVDESMSAALSGLWNAAVCFSNFILPLIGSALETTLPYYISFSASVLIGYGSTLMLATLIFLYRYHLRLDVSR